MSRVLMVTPEATPFAKSGGLADVLGALPQALLEQGEDVAVAMPKYRGISRPDCHRVYDQMDVWLGSQRHGVEIWSVVERGVTFYFVNAPWLFDRDALYGHGTVDYPDNHVRFATFCGAVLGIMRYLWRPQVVHCHDWQSALVPVYLRHRFPLDPTFLGIKKVFTIHNLGFQGLFDPGTLADAGLDSSVLEPGRLGFHGRVNWMKGAILTSDAVTTVSRGYAREIQREDLGFGLDGVLRSRAAQLCGILNGVDYQEWNPQTDPYIAAHYSAENLSGKQLCKEDLLREFGLAGVAADAPLIGMVSRFVDQKGYDLIAAIAEDLLRENVGLVMLGTGDILYENRFRELAARHPDRVGVKIAYDNRLAHKIEAGADLFLMPSRYEPCGLNQIYSLRYGTVPVVRATGGLDDTIEEGTGFKFSEYSGRSLLQTLRSALAVYRDRTLWEALMRRGMQRDFSWSASAAEYSGLYRRLLFG